MKVEVNIPCCVCNNLDSHELFDVEFLTHTYPGLFHIRKCNECGLIFNSPRLPDEKFPELYLDSYYFYKKSNQEAFFRTIQIYQRTVALLDENIKNKEVLEIGSAKGYLLAVMKRLGWKVQGIDISTVAADFAKRKLKVTTEQGRLEDYVKKTGSDKKKFPLILAIDVIEHVLYPKQFIEDIAGITAPDGKVIIDTPNGNAANIDLDQGGWKGFNPFHVFLFSVDNLTTMFAEHGFVVEKAFSYNNDDLKSNNNSNLSGAVKKTSPNNAKHVVKEMLKKVGLFDMGVAAYQFYEKLYDNLLNKHVGEACREIEKGQTYFHTPDSKGPYEENCRGDNLVVIFRKNFA